MDMDMDEKYRTLLGHLRHKIGHYYWDYLGRNGLTRDGGHLHSFRDLFTDKREDYGDALQAHYENGPPEDWQERFVSSYASSHAWD